VEKFIYYPALLNNRASFKIFELFVLFSNNFLFSIIFFYLLTKLHVLSEHGGINQRFMRVNDPRVVVYDIKDIKKYLTLFVPTIE